MKTKKNSQTLRNELFAILGETGARLLIACLDQDIDSGHLLGDWFEEKGDLDRAKLARDSVPDEPWKMQNLAALESLLMTLPSVKTVAQDWHHDCLTKLWTDRQHYRKHPEGGTLIEEKGWQPSSLEDPYGIIDEGDEVSRQFRCRRKGHISSLFSRALLGHCVPKDIADGRVRLRLGLKRLLLERLPSHIL